MTSKQSSPPTSNPPSAPDTRVVRRVLGAEEEILEGVGLTRLNKPFRLPTQKAQSLAAEGPRFKIDKEA